MLTVVVNGWNDSRVGVAIQITVSYIVLPVQPAPRAGGSVGYRLLALFIKKHRQLNGFVMSARPRSMTLRRRTMCDLAGIGMTALGPRTARRLCLARICRRIIRLAAHAGDSLEQARLAAVSRP